MIMVSLSKLLEPACLGGSNDLYTLWPDKELFIDICNPLSVGETQLQPATPVFAVNIVKGRDKVGEPNLHVLLESESQKEHSPKKREWWAL